MRFVRGQMLFSLLKQQMKIYYKITCAPKLIISNYPDDNEATTNKVILL
jgi:hypothetical protein